ncbi:MAG: efflux RND transporter permease subunit [Chloroflexi bacterium]|nr:efflux RND transporter permease subunit [Chloroflexota bacterium]
MNLRNAEGREVQGPIAYMCRNGVAANLLMFLIVAAGLVSLTGLVQEAFPPLTYNQIEVSAPYPGATPEEVEESIVLKIEEHLATIEAVASITAIAARGRASVMVELESGADMERGLDDVEAAVARIRSFPVDAERPEIRRMTNRQSLIRLVIHGDVPERALKELAYRTEDRLASLAGVSYVETAGVRDYEISIDVRLDRLQALGLTLRDIADAVRTGSLELSAGSVETVDADILVRTMGRTYSQQDFEDIIVLARNDGTAVRLGDIADVRDGFRDVALIVRHNGRQAAFVEVYRTADERVLDVARVVKDHLERHIVPSLPAGVGITIWNNDADVYEERRNVLLENGFLGLVLVLLSLTLFLQIRLAVWVAAGIAVSVVGTLATMLVLDLSINSFSMFGVVIVIGIVVDDAVVVSESIFLERQRNTGGTTAAIRGTRRVTRPLVFGVLTTMAAFSPLLFVPGFQGDIIRPLPIILISVLALSLVDSMLILPNHLSHLPAPGMPPTGSLERLFGSVQARIDRGTKRFISGPLDRWLGIAIRRPEIVIAGVTGTFVLCIALIPAGIVDVTIDQPVEGNLVTARLEMPEGTPAIRTNEVAREIEAAGRRAIDLLSADRPTDDPPLFAGITSTVGMEARQELGGFFLEPGLDPQSHIATVEFKLLSAAQRDLPAAAFQAAWREETGVVPQARGLTFTSTLIDFGRPIHAELSHEDPDRLGPISEAVERRLGDLDGVFDVRSNRSSGLQEIRLELRPEARTLGVTLDELARQMRSAFFGEEALRVQRGREDVRVYVRLPAEERNSIADVEAYLIRTPAGATLPLSRVASLRLENSPAKIFRRDGRRTVSVTADVDPSVITGEEARSFLEARIIPEMVNADPGLIYAFGGRGQEAVESFDSLGRGFVLALVSIYVLLAIALGSYTKPLIVMAVIPVGTMGAILGHLVMGLDLTFMSFMGMLGLTGVVVNDSLVMMGFIDRKISAGAPIGTAIVEGAKGRFRPIFLTSVTTFLGLAPLTFEQGIQAQLLVPVGVSMGFGIVFATAVLLLLVPALTIEYHRLVGHAPLPLPQEPYHA